MNIKTLLLTGLLSLSALPASAQTVYDHGVTWSSYGGWNFTQSNIICDVNGNTLLTDTCRPKNRAEREQSARINQMRNDAYDEVMSDWSPSRVSGCQGCTGRSVPLDMSTVNQGYSTTIESTGAGMPRVGR